MEFIANGIVKENGLKQYVVTDELTVLENYEKMFGQKGMNIILAAFRNYGDGNFYQIARYYQYIGLLQYRLNPKSLTLTFFEIQDMDNFLDAFSKLQIQDWKQGDLKKVGDTIQEIIDDKNKELATISIKKLF
ncbi:hypothetical protein [Mucilaginibacter sp.]|jgi:hypothetical protein|uniref:hypothetical protein n=1 Tax=Mucilaginibacter sp. TaxID=1882438 RepID=UPI002B880C69|nr:hypothetical protein [Mucilaginibacter sp.]HTI61793.1 hypothetical protein [Mucilaginibacter sp.]